MRKILVLSFVLFMAVNFVTAEPIVLSDRIQQARDAQKMQEAKQKAELAMMKSASSQTVEDKCNLNEKTAAEKINICPNKNSQ